MFAIVPYHVDVPMSRWPLTNFLMIGAIVYAYIRMVSSTPEAVAPYILDGWSATAMFGYMFLHAGPLHLVGNMVFLWTFGNAVCAKIGNLAYIPTFLGLGIAAAVVHNILSGEPAVGASGAINGIVGMYLVYYPLNNVTYWYWFIIRFGRFSISGIWMILLWLGFDIWGAYSGGGGVAYWAHLGGFATGVAIAIITLLTGMVEMSPSERSLLGVFGRG